MEESDSMLGNGYNGVAAPPVRSTASAAMRRIQQEQREESHDGEDSSDDDGDYDEADADADADSASSSSRDYSSGDSSASGNEASLSSRDSPKSDVPAPKRKSNRDDPELRSASGNVMPEAKRPKVEDKHSDPNVKAFNEKLAKWLSNNASKCAHLSDIGSWVSSTYGHGFKKMGFGKSLKKHCVKYPDVFRVNESEGNIYAL